MRSTLLVAAAAMAAMTAPAAAQVFSGSDGVLTPDGRYLAYVAASDGSTGVFVHDLQSGISTLVSVADDGSPRPGGSGVGLAPWAAGDGVAIGLSDDGRIAAFPSTAALAADDVDAILDVYIRDRLTGTTVRASRGPGGSAANGPSWAPRVSGDGRFVVFASAASNLVPDDTNGVEDVFLFDRLAAQLRRLSVSTAGAQSDQPSIRPAISADGAVVAFVSFAATLAPDPPTCYVSAPPDPRDRPCGQVFVHDRLAATTTRVSPVLADRTMTNADVSADGRLVAGLSGAVSYHPYAIEYFFVLDRVTGVMLREGVHEVQPAVHPLEVTVYPARNLDLSADGRYVAIGPNLRSGGNDLQPTTHVHAVPREPLPGQRNRGVDEAMASRAGQLIMVSGDGHLLLESWSTAGAGAITLTPRDRDGDRMLDVWERHFGLDPSVADAASDPDGDGMSNAVEYLVGGNPTGGVPRYFAESAYSSWFRSTYALFNPNATAATVALRYIAGTDAWDSGTFLRLRPGEHTLIDLAPLVPGSFAAIVEADVPVIAERTMTWDASGFGSHAETAQANPSTTWLFAEGSTGGGFDVYYLLFNPTSEPAHVAITYLRTAPAPPLVVQHIVPPYARTTIHVDDEHPALAATDVAASIVSDRPLVAERAMYLTTGQAIFAAGHAAAGVTNPAPRWFLAEGATGPYFDTFLLVVNPSSSVARLRLTFVLPGGESVVTERVVPGDSRMTVRVDEEDVRLANTAVSTIVESVDGIPVVVERAMWWPSGAWQEGHATAGATATGRRWAFANGDLAYTQMRPVYEPGGDTYLLILNTSDVAGAATIRLTSPCLHECGPAAVALPPRSRVTIPLSVLRPGNIGDPHFGIVVESDGPEIVVERAIYKESGNVVWAAGSVVMGTRLP